MPAAAAPREGRRHAAPAALAVPHVNVGLPAGTIMLGWPVGLVEPAADDVHVNLPDQEPRPRRGGLSGDKVSFSHDKDGL